MAKYGFCTLCLALAISDAMGNFAEFFAASTHSAALGGQSHLTEDPGNNYYAPALMSGTRKLQFSLSSFHVDHKFRPISQVRIRDNGTRGTVPTNYENLNYTALHLVLPILRPKGLTLGASAFTPMDNILESQSGDPFLPEYVMYRARSNRGLFHCNLAGPFPSSRYSWSLGFYTGTKIRSRTFSGAHIGDDPQKDTSYARMAASSSLTMAGIASLGWRGERSAWALTLQQEMENRYSFHVEGEVQNPRLPFDITMDTLAYYDPYLARLSHFSQLGRAGLHASLEYQHWKNYQTPVIRIRQNPMGNINSSQNVETISLRNIWLPKLGLSFQYNEHNTGLLGLAYRPTPLRGNFSGPGNSIDADKAILAAGHQIKFRNFALNFSLQYHHLISNKVVKNSESIGYPGYEIGGRILNTSLGLTMEL